MVQRGYLQSYASTSQRGETILPPVMPAPMTVKCQKLATKGDHRGIRPNAAKPPLEAHHAIIGIIGAGWVCKRRGRLPTGQLQELVHSKFI
jgi:hypothetical protein